jgi:hypothetical protein
MPFSLGLQWSAFHPPETDARRSANDANGGITGHVAGQGEQPMCVERLFNDLAAVDLLEAGSGFAAAP